MKTAVTVLGPAALALLGGLAAPARGATLAVADELSAGSTQATASNPNSWYLSDRLSGIADLRSVSLRLDAQWTHDAASPAPAGANFATSAADVFLLSLGAEWQPTSHLLFGLEGDYSPPASTATDAPITLTSTSRGARSTSDEDARLASRTSTAGGALWAGYDTAGDSRFETNIEAGFGATEYFLDDQITDVWSSRLDRAQPTSSVLASCAAHRCSPSLLAALEARPAALFQGKASLALTETIADDTDLRVAGNYYFYDKDPTRVGYFSRASHGRLQTREASFGGGLPIAPYMFTVQPSFTERVGGVSVALSFQFGQYVSDEAYSYDLNLGIKTQYKISRRFRVWLKVSGQRDVDSTNTVSYGGAIALGTRASF
jgi:hypothetical protein